MLTQSRHEDKDTRKIKSSPNVFVFADKTNNIDEMSKDHHQKPLPDDVTKTYQNAPPKLETSINLEAKSISTKLKINDRVQRIAMTPAFVTLKYHKYNFSSGPMCCLINPSQNELGKVSNQLVEKQTLILLTNYNLISGAIPTLF